ncbi:putative secreted protein [Psilocybe cubensis]|uniref:PLC-like phosphodiesterase n=2 Tax=Psilocybe cubensis TaxID=181762 RepID=A0A8H7YAQ9_PSICU|nr:putative secreted protein [Psilocybe cubensis]KAH9486546.1 putative secreted protein [Psilocybe cubensis]
MFRSLTSLAVLTLASTASLTHALSGSTLASEALNRRATVCNGHAELCNRSFGNVTFVGAHDSYAIGVNNLAANQDQPITQQLNDGIRMLQMQAHNESGVIRLCHTSCSLYDGGTLQDYLTTVKQWMDSNPNEVLSLLIVNIDNLPASSYAPVFQAVGLDKLSYAPPSLTLPASQWPTLGSLIDSGKRLLTFLDNAADFNSVPYLLDEFTNIWETAFNVVDPNFDCNVNRTKGDPTSQMFLINHFLDKMLLGQPVPDIDNANRTNSASGFGSLGAHVDTCVADHGRPPNFLLVDFYEYGGGSVFQVAADINGVPYNPATPVATPATSNGPSNSGSSGTTGVTSKPLSGGTTLHHFSIYNYLLTGLALLIASTFGPFLLS